MYPDQPHRMRLRWKQMYFLLPYTSYLHSPDDLTQILINFFFKADSMVHEKLDKHRECFDILSRGPTGLQSAIPSAGGVQPGLQDSPVVGKLRELMEAVDTIKAERWEAHKEKPL